MKNKNIYDVVIIGSGPAGYSAGIYSARANLKTLMISGWEEGGQLMLTTEVENYPGFEHAVQGADLMEAMKKQAQNVGVEMLQAMVMNVDFSSRPFKLQTDLGTEIIAKTVIISTGAQAKWLGLESEKFFQGYGVSGCATCDGFFFKNKKVAVVGGGNTAVEEAIYLTNHASEVYLIHRKNSLRAEKILQDRLFANPKVKLIWNAEVREIVGTNEPKSVTGVVLNTPSGEEKLELDGIFIAIGHKPSTEIFKNSGIELDGEGYVITKAGTTKTNIEGVFAAGDVQDKIYRQAVTAAGTGCMAALDAQKFIENNTQKKIEEDEFKPLHTEGSDIKNKLYEMKCEIGRRFYFSDMSREDFHSKIYNPVVKSYKDANEVDLDNIDAQYLELATLINEKLKKHVCGK